jgi:5-methylcytosine-specific restriction enzyme A
MANSRKVRRRGLVAISKVVFKRITASDFYYINQPGLEGGGGQSYIDFDTSDISYLNWSTFFNGVHEQGAKGGPFWTFAVHNLGSNTIQQNVKIGQRRATSFSIRSQKLPEHSNGGHRLHAWSPKLTGFPELPVGVGSAEQVPIGLIAGLTIFLIRDENGEFWSGWSHDVSNSLTDRRLVRMFEEHAGFIDLAGEYTIDKKKPNWPFEPPEAVGFDDQPDLLVPAPRRASASSATTEDQDNEQDRPRGANDLEGWLDEDELDTPEPDIGYVVGNIRQRDRRAMRSVRKMYSICQITGEEFVFITKKGAPYLEVHHLVPLGRGGADSPHNMIVVSAHAHRMLHYAEVSNIDLSAIKDNKLTIRINGQEFYITWAPKHAEVVLRHNPA